MTNKNDFLPGDYKVPAAPSRYMKFVLGDNRFRILGAPILGYEWWVDENGNPKAKGDRIVKGDKPKRVSMDDNYPDTAKHFWAMPVWNYDAKAVQILEITQLTITKAIRHLSINPKWGSPFGYDIVVTKTGSGLDTEYVVNPDPKEDVDPEIKAKYESMNINIEALFEGKDPFGEKEEKFVELKDGETFKEEDIPF